MKNIRFGLLFLAIIFATNAYVQTVNLSKGFNSLDQAFVYDAIKESVLLLRQEYIVQDEKGQSYGKSNKDYYGAYHFLGIVAGNRIWCPSSINKPWELDPNADYTSEYKPVVHKLFIRNESVNKFEFVNRNKISASDTEMLDKYGLFYFDYDKNGIKIKAGHKSPEGWVALAYTDKTDIDVNTNIKWAIFKRELRFKTGENTAIIENFPAITNVIGGIFLEPTFNDGQIIFNLTGILEKKVVNWYVNTIPPVQPSSCKGFFKCWKEKRTKKKKCKQDCMQNN